MKLKRCDQWLGGSLCPLPLGHPTIECRAATPTESALWEEQQALLGVLESIKARFEPGGWRGWRGAETEIVALEAALKRNEAP